MPTQMAVVLPRRQAAKRAAMNMADQLSESDTDSEAEGSPFKPPASSRKASSSKGKVPTTRRMVPTKPQRTPSTASQTTETAPRLPKRAGPTTPRPSSQKRKRSAVDTTSYSDGDVMMTGLEDLSPLTSPESSPARPRRPVSTSSSRTNLSSVLLVPPRPKALSFNSSSSVLKALFNQSPNGKGKEKMPMKMVCRVGVLEKYAFVHINMDGDITADSMGIWWPAKVDRARLDPSIICRVSLLGRPPGPTRGLIPLLSQGEDVIRPLRSSNGTFSFTLATFRSSNLPDISSPRKKAKSESKESPINMRWQSAMSELKSLDSGDATDTDSDCELPQITTPASSQISHAPSTPSRNGNTPAKVKPREPTPELDHEVELDNGLVLSMHGKNKYYWPAKVTGFDEKTGKYRVHYFDGIEEEVLRETFFLPGSQGFITCELGKINTAEPPDDSIDDNDDAHIAAERARLFAALDAPLPDEAPNNLNMRYMSDQLPYILPVMLAVLAGTYAPARAVHDNFIAGGSKRAKVLQSDVLLGDLTQGQKNALERVLKVWLFGDENLEYLALQKQNERQWLESNPFGSTPPPSSLLLASVPQRDAEGFRPRLRGGEDYESFSELERLEYCTNVIKPEACYQLLLWYKGKRTQREVLDDAQEERLHAQALELAAQPDLVVQLRDLRKFYSGGKLASFGRKHAPSATDGASRTRRRGGLRSKPSR